MSMTANRFLGFSKSSTAKSLVIGGYISQVLFSSLFAQGAQLITKLRKDMKNKLLPLLDKLLLRKRSLIEM